MTKHGTRLVMGVKELILTSNTTLEDLHMVAVEVILAIDKIAARTVRRLKEGQKIRCYVEAANKEYGARGSDTICYYRNSYDTQTYGTKIKVYDLGSDKEWSVGLDCLLEVYEEFDPNSPTGKKLAVPLTPIPPPKLKKRGRKSKKEKEALEEQQALVFQENWGPSYGEEEDEEYNFDSYEEYEDFYDE